MIPDNPERGNWPRVEITSEGYDEGLGIGDINGDGLLDISGRYGKDGKSLAWWQNPGNGSGNWTKHPVGTTRVEMDRNVMADLNGDGYVGGAAELMPLYFAAARDFGQPVFAYGPPRLVRLGVEFAF